MSTRELKNRAKRLLRGALEVGQRFGVDVLPRHYYSEIPNIRELRRSTEWRQPLSMARIYGDIASQIDFVDRCTMPFREELPRLMVLKRALAMNGTDEGFGSVEADFLYCFVRKYRPLNIVQVGCGVSTAVILMASMDQGYKPNIVCVEPYPTAFLQEAAAAGEIRLVEKKLQEVYQDCAGWVSEGDLFFVDSSHTLGPGGEVSRIILEILPHLSSCVFTHFHDIWFPYDYDPRVLSDTLFFWHETAMLGAFLSMNRQFRIEASLSMLHHQMTDELRRCLPTYNPARFVDGIHSGGAGDYPCSVYLRN